MRAGLLSVSRTATTAAGALLIGLAFAVPSAAGSSAWWHLRSASAPAVLAPGSNGQILVTVSNLGDADANGAATPVVVSDTLPAGLKATAIEAQGEGGSLEGGPPLECSLASLSCSDAQNVAPYEQIQVRIAVAVQAGASAGEVNRASVSGGGVRGASVARAVAIGGAPTPFGVEEYEMLPEEEGGAPDTQAGSHPFQLTTTFALNQTNDAEHPPALPKDLHFQLPAGLIGNPTPFPQCTDPQFLTSSEFVDLCPARTQLGVAAVTVQIPSFGPVAHTVTVPLFNLKPKVGEPARFGFDVANIPVLLDTSVRTGGDYGVTVSAENISQIAAFGGSRVTFWGVPGDARHDNARGWSCIDNEFFRGLLPVVLPPCTALGEANPAPFLALPTSCTGALRTSVDADSWQQPGVFETVPSSRPLPALDGCNRLPFSPSISVAPDGQAASTPTGLTVGVHVPQDASLNPAGRAEADVKDTTVVLPAGVQLSPAAADGLLSCSLEQVGLQNGEEAACPEASKVATAEIRSPLLPDPLVGEVYLAAQNANPFGSLVAMYLVARDPVSGVLVKLAGKVVPDPVTGQLVSTFENTPQLPFEDLTLHFFGSARAPLSTPPLCGSYTTQATIAPWSGNEAATPSSSFDITSGPNGAPCSDPQPFAPGFQAGSTNLQAGAFTPFELTMSRPDADQTLSRVEMQMPPGLLGTLSSVKLCGEPQAAQGTCGEDSLIGHTVVSAGLGNDPYTVTGGKVFITTGYKGGAYGLSIVNPAKAGPFDLGNVIVRASINVDPHTAALKIVSDPLPTIIDGIPLQIQHVNVSVDRAGFTFNPTNCGKMAINGTLSSSGGASAAVSTPFQVTNCATLAFKPKLTASTSGKTSRAAGASLHVKLTYPSGPFDANIAKVKVDLPKQLPSRLTTLQKACTSAQFDANPASCPAASLIGHAKAITPVIPVALEGPAYFVSHGGEAFPSLEIVLQGYGTTVDLVGSTFISKAGVTSSTFKSVPDVPVGTFELTLPQGKFSALAANGSLCKSKLAMPTAFLGQNGAEIHQSTPITVSGCSKTKKKAKQHKAAKRRSKTKRKG